MKPTLTAAGFALIAALSSWSAAYAVGFSR